MANAGDRGAAEVRNVANMTAALNNQAPVTSFSDALASADRRAKARQGIVNRGDAAVRNQQLKDRLAIAKGQISRRGDLINTLQTSANIREGVNAGLSDANNQIRQSNAGMWGSIAGGAARFGKQWLNNRPPAGVTTQSMDMGTAAADMISQPLWDPSTTMMG
jgi:monoamine oxidase